MRRHLLGLAFVLAGPGCGPCGSTELVPIQDGTFVWAAPRNERLPLPLGEGDTLEIDGTSVILSYVDDQGRTVEVVWAANERLR